MREDIDTTVTLNISLNERLSTACVRLTTLALNPLSPFARRHCDYRNDQLAGRNASVLETAAKLPRIFMILIWVDKIVVFLRYAIIFARTLNG